MSGRRISRKSFLAKTALTAAGAAGAPALLGAVASSVEAAESVVVGVWPALGIASRKGAEN